MKFGLIGCSRISDSHLKAALQNEDIEVKAICDLQQSQMDDKRERFGLSDDVKSYLDFKDMLEAEDLDFVAVCTDSGSHAFIATDCLNAGVHVIIEKPIALSIEDANKIIEAGKKNNKKIAACHQNRFKKSIQRIRKAVEEDKFGKLLHGAAHVRWNRGKSYYEEAPWRGTWAKDGGALLNQCIHNIDILRWMMGDDIDEVVAYTDRLTHPYIEAEDLGLALVKFSNGSYGIIEGTTNVYPRNLEETLYMFGSEGTVKAGGKSLNTIETWNFAQMPDENAESINKELAHVSDNTEESMHAPLYKDMVEAIKQDRDPYIDGEAGKRALELVLAIYKSSKEGKPVKLPLESFSTKDMEGFFSE